MTIKPKKNKVKDKSEQESSDNHTHSQVSIGHAVSGHHGHTHGLAHYHHANVPENRLDKQSSRSRNSPPRWLPSTSGRDDVGPGLAGAAPFEYETIEPPSNHKRRHRSSPHRTVRKHRNHPPSTAAMLSSVVCAAGSSSVPSDLELDHQLAACDDDDEEYNSEDEHCQRRPVVPENVNEVCFVCISVGFVGSILMYSVRHILEL